MIEYLYYVEQWDPAMGETTSWPVALFEEWEDAVLHAHSLRRERPDLGAKAVGRILPVRRRTEEVA